MDIMNVFQRVQSALNAAISNGNSFKNTLLSLFADDAAEVIPTLDLNQVFTLGKDEAFQIVTANAEKISILHAIKEDGSEFKETVDLFCSEFPDNLKTAVFTKGSHGIATVRDLLSSLVDSIRTNEIVCNITTMIQAQGEGALTGNLMQYLNQCKQSFGNMPIIDAIKDYVLSAGDRFTEFNWASAIGSLYGRVQQTLTGSTQLSAFVDALPAVDAFDWTVVSGVFQTIGQVVGVALLGVSKVVGAVVSGVLTLFNQLGNVLFGEDNYGVDGFRTNGYLNIPILAQKFPNRDLDHEDAIISQCTAFADVYDIWSDGWHYRNVFLKPLLDANGHTPFDVQFRASTGVVTRVREGSIPLLVHHAGGSQSWAMVYMPPQTIINSAQDYYLSEYNCGRQFEDTKTLNKGFFASLLVYVLQFYFGRSYWWRFWPKINYQGSDYPLGPLAIGDFSGPIVSMIGGQVFTEGTFATKDPQTALAQVMAALAYSVAGDAGYLYTKDLGNAITYFRQVCDTERSLSADQDWDIRATTPFQINADASQLTNVGLYSKSSEVVPPEYVNAGFTFSNQAITTFDIFDSFIKSPNWAISWLMAQSLTYVNGSTNGQYDYSSMTVAEMKDNLLTSISNVPEKTTFTMPNASIQMKIFSAAITTAAIIGVTVGAVIVGKRLQKKYQNWQTKRGRALAQQYQDLNPKSPTYAKDVAAYNKAVRKYNFVNKFLPGDYTFNSTSGWAEKVGGEDSTNSKLSALSGASDEISLYDIWNVLTGYPWPYTSLNSNPVKD